MIAPLKRKALLITRNLPPLTGGMERLNWHLAYELAKDYETYVCGPSGCENQMPDNVRVCATFAAQPVSRFLIQSLYRSVRTMQNIRPDLIIAGSGVTAPHAVLTGRYTDARTLAYLHGLDLIAKHPLYRWGFLPFIRRCQGILVNSQNTARLAASASIEPYRINVLHPGVELPTDLNQTDASTFRTNLNIGDRPILLSVGRLAPRKGLREFVRRALPKIAAARPDVLLVIIGGEANQKLVGASNSVGAAILDTASERGVSEHIQLLGRVDDDTLAQAYLASDLHIFPVLDLPDDVEGFGMVAVEAAAHGLPTVAFNAGGIADAVAHGQSGLLITPQDYDTMATTIIDLLNQKNSIISTKACRRFAEPFGWDRFGERLRAICYELSENKPYSHKAETQ